MGPSEHHLLLLIVHLCTIVHDPFFLLYGAKIVNKFGDQWEEWPTSPQVSQHRLLPSLPPPSLWLLPVRSKDPCIGCILELCMAATPETCSITLLRDAVGWLANYSLRLLDASGPLPWLNWCHMQTHSSESGAPGACTCCSTYIHSVKPDTHSQPSFHSDSQSCCNVVTASGGLLATCTVAERPFQTMPAPVCTANWGLAHTGALYQHWSSPVMAQPFVNGSPKPSVKPNLLAWSQK